MLTFDQVSRTFSGGVRALEAVSFHVPENRVTILLGASGSGKTTLLRLAAGLDTPTDGFVRFSDVRPHIGYVFQTPTLLPWATVAQNVELPLRLAGVPIGGQVDEALRAVGLSERAQAFPHELSGGMQMRVSIARALTLEPKLLLLDEPFAALDELTRQRLQILIHDLVRSRGLTLISVTHAITEACFLADQVVILRSNPGRVDSLVPINGPRKRDDNWRLSSDFNTQCSHLFAALSGTLVSP
jgi:NitT/TauT family transport system ATP-binding protein